MSTFEERQAQGSSARTRTPRKSHAGWVPSARRRHPVDLLEDQNTAREPDLVPVRRGRMMVSPFTFYRGAARARATRALTGSRSFSARSRWPQSCPTAAGGCITQQG